MPCATGERCKIKQATSGPPNNTLHTYAASVEGTFVDYVENKVQKARMRCTVSVRGRVSNFDDSAVRSSPPPYAKKVAEHFEALDRLPCVCELSHIAELSHKPELSQMR